MELIIVESPVKAKTIEKYLKSLKAKGKYVIATGGHITTMPTSSMSIDFSNGEYIGKYSIIQEKKATIEKIKSLAKKATNVFCCQDDDREGERIAEDVVEVCKIKRYYRVTFHEITISAIKQTLIDKEGIRLIDKNIVSAQKTRRIIDRLIGWKLQPAMRYYFNKEFKDRESKPDLNKGIGRVSAYALGIIYNQEQNIIEFNEKDEKDKESFVIIARYNVGGISFSLKGKNLEFKRNNYSKMQEVLQKASSEIHEVVKYNPAFEEVVPYPAFTTAKLYSACSFVFRMEPTRTSAILQELFNTGYITYPRTDSVIVSDSSAEAIVVFLKNILPNDKHSDILFEKRKYKNNEYAQAGHPAIYPIFIDIDHSPRHISSTWKKDPACKNFTESHKKVYNLIWDRTIATQLINASYETPEVEIMAGDYVFKGKGRKPSNLGWKKYFKTLSSTELGGNKEDWTDDILIIPELYIGDIMSDVIVDYYVKKARQPKRVSEGALIQTLRADNVSRPSTIHTVSSTLFKKGYIKRVSTFLVPTEQGMLVAKFLQEYLQWLIDEEAQKFEDNISLIEKDALSPKELIDSYVSLLDELNKKIGYDKTIHIGGATDKLPSDKQISFVMSLYNKLPKNEQDAINLEDILKNSQTASTFISKNFH